jgi:hypothetical protein
MSSKLLHLDPFAAAMARKEREERERQEAEASETPPTPDVAPTRDVATTLGAAPPPHVAPPQTTQPPLQNVAPPVDVALPADVAPEQFTRVVNGIFDRILPSLKPAEQLVLLRLYRLTRGFNKEICRVTIGKLATSCNIGTTATRLAVQALESRGYIRRAGTDVANTNQNNRGIDFEMLLPAAAPPRRVGATRPVAPTPDAAPPLDVANKIKTIKENTQTQEPAAGVRVGSRFSIEECRRYAQHLQSTGQGINNPGGYATTIHRMGEADELIEKFLNPTASIQVDSSQCPDCKGSGFYYPNGPTGGVAKCKHEKLDAES